MTKYACCCGAKSGQWPLRKFYSHPVSSSLRYALSPSSYHSSIPVLHNVALKFLAVVHVPKDKLEAAAELALADAEAAQNDVENNLIKETVDVMNETSKTVIPLVGPVVVEMQREDDYLIEIEPLANNAKAKPAQTSTKKPKTKASSSGVQEVVEIAVFTDPEFYTEMQIRYPKETNTKIKEYILTLVNAVRGIISQSQHNFYSLFQKMIHIYLLLHYWTGGLALWAKVTRDWSRFQACAFGNYDQETEQIKKEWQECQGLPDFILWVRGGPKQAEHALGPWTPSDWVRLEGKWI